ncbi:MerR family transcriptional regulator [Pseudotabrizicola alkalilacus]|uniref:MerR family transcriptional regulator n=1 Tax=Pseudotabrizicola alkalilacus TaxID=2305252 RepID=UPI001F21A04B|nr:MerR family transcriptional regulator [Pseudotabrizicola alkalilacus]
MNKSPDAFRTISEVADLLETPAHVLRFWESRFPQIRPVKRAGGRRYYRPADVALLTGIKRLLHDEGLTIRGVQKILREQGVRYVSGVSDDSADTDEDDDLATALAAATGAPDPSESLPPAEAETAQIIALQAALREPVAPPPVPAAESAEPAPEVAEVESEAEADAPADWQADSAAEDAADVSLPQDTAPVVPEPPPPVTVAPVVAAPSPPTPAAPVVTDLFSRVPPPPPPAAPEAPVAEAPMAVWADEADVSHDPAKGESPEPSPPAVLRITRIGAAPAPGPEEPAPVPPALPVMAEPPVITGPTLGQRLRAVSAADLATADRQRLSDLRDQAMALRARLSGPARAQG